MRVKSANLIITAINEQPSWSAQLIWEPRNHAYAVLVVTTGSDGYVLRSNIDALRFLAGQRDELAVWQQPPGTANCGCRRGLYSSPCGT